MPAPAAPRRMQESLLACPHDGHLVTTSRCPRNMRRGPGPKGRRRADGVPGFGRPGQARATTAAPPPTGKRGLVGLGRLERPTSRLSGVRSNQLSYRPERHPAGPRNPGGEGRAKPMTSSPQDPWSDGCVRRDVQTAAGDFYPSSVNQDRPMDLTCMPGACTRRWGPREVVERARRQQVPPTQTSWGAFRKEVIQPQVPLRLPCYDFTPVADPTVDACPPCWVSPAASGRANSHGVTGGVYKARERIHRGVLIRDY